MMKASILLMNTKLMTNISILLMALKSERTPRERNHSDMLGCIIKIVTRTIGNTGLILTEWMISKP